jgi:addiction module RelE/StbE family toxin
MNIFLHKDFKREYKKLTKSQKEKFKARRSLFLVDQFNPILNNHALAGKYKGYRSFNITGDLRAIFTLKENLIIFVKIGSHSNLYG